MMDWWPWVILAVGSSAAEQMQLLRDYPVLPSFSVRILERRKLSPTDRQSRAGSRSWTISCRIRGAAGRAANVSGGEVASPGVTV